ncbi:MAG: hypothetical protein ABFS42_14470 [Candidatus Krumholzibacteriota bacterium]
MRRLIIATLLVSLGLAGSAMAACDVELGFSPDVAAPGDMVTMFVSIANLGDTDEIADIEIMITFMGYEVGPLMGQLPLAAGEELSQECTFMVPPLPMGGTLSISVTATCGGMSDTATASLTIEVPEGSAGFDGLDGVGAQLLSDIASSPVGVENATFGDVKALFR